MSKKRQLQKMKVIALSVNEERAAPEWVQLLPIGKTEANGHSFVVDAESMEKMIKHFNEMQNDLVFDYEHQTLKGGEAPAAGWIKSLEARTDGLWGQIDWTERARQYIEAGEYKYISPVVHYNTDDLRCYELHSAALTNKPAIDGMAAVAAKEEGGNEKMDFMKQVSQLLGLDPETATEEEVLAALQAAIMTAADGGATVEEVAEQIETAIEEAVGEQLEEVEVLLDEVATVLEEEKTAAAKAKVGAFKNKLRRMKKGSTGIGTQIVAAFKEKTKSDTKKQSGNILAKMAVENAIQSGKILPAMRTVALSLALSNPEGFAAMVQNAQPVIPQGKVADGAVRTGVTVSAAQKAMNRSMGISDEDFTKFGGGQ